MTTPIVHSLTDEFIAEIQAAADTATHKNWFGKGDEIGYISREDDQSYGMFCPLAVIYSELNVDHIAMANPTTILALLSERAALIAERDALKADAELCKFRIETIRQLFGYTVPNDAELDTAIALARKESIHD